MSYTVAAVQACGVHVMLPCMWGVTACTRPHAGSRYQEACLSVWQVCQAVAAAEDVWHPRS